MNKRGFTLVELVVVVMIISTLTIASLYGINQSSQRTKIARAQKEVNQLRDAIILYHTTTGEYPPGPYDTAQNDIRSEANWNNPANGLVPDVFERIQADPWGNMYQYDGHPTTECGQNQSAVCSAGFDEMFESFDAVDGPLGDDVCSYFPPTC